MPDSMTLDLSRRATMKAASGLALWSFAPPLARAADTAATPLVVDRRDQPFDDDWRFFRGDGQDFALPAHDDREWRRVDLPHDWSIEDRNPEDKDVNAKVRDVDTAPVWQTVAVPPRAIGPFDAQFSMIGDPVASEGGWATGFTVGGIGWYRKRFHLPTLAPDARVAIDFDGVYMNCQVWLNGVSLGHHPNGYTPFGFDLTPYLDRSGDNVLAVRVANTGRNSRWYSGSGIYRRVRLSITGPTRFARWGLVVTTPTVSAARAAVQMRAKIEGAFPGTVLVTRIKDLAGRVVAEKRAEASETTLTSLDMSAPRLWSPQSPSLYLARMRLVDRRARGRPDDHAFRHPQG